MRVLGTKRQLSQQEIDAVFAARHTQSHSEKRIVPYDFLRPDRLPPAQLRAIQLLHENFARSLASSLSAYLRSYVLVNLVSFEQISYAEFVGGLPSPTAITALNLRPHDGAGVLELSPNLFFPILETLLGGTPNAKASLTREITEVEERLLEGLLRVIVQDLRTAWRSVAPIDFTVQTIEKEPQFLQVLAPSEAVVAIGVEICVGNTAGSLNIAIPSLLIKMMRNKFDQQWTARKADPTPEEQVHMLHFVSKVDAELEVQIPGAGLSVREVAGLKPGDLLLLDYAVGRNVLCRVNGDERFQGRIVQSGRHRAIVIDSEADSPKPPLQ